MLPKVLKPKDGVVKNHIYDHLPQIHDIDRLLDNIMNHMDLGTPPEPGGETFRFL
jgi:hypothetical protein